MTECVICLEVVEENLMKKIVCGHTFHKSCINDWIKCKNECPICRHKIVDDPVVIQIEAQTIEHNTSIHNITSSFIVLNSFFMIILGLSDENNNFLLITGVLNMFLLEHETVLKYIVLWNLLVSFVILLENLKMYENTIRYYLVYVSVLLQNILFVVLKKNTAVHRIFL